MGPGLGNLLSRMPRHCIIDKAEAPGAIKKKVAPTPSSLPCLIEIRVARKTIKV